MDRPQYQGREIMARRFAEEYEVRDLRNEWQGKVWALRRMPRHWTLTDPDAHLIAARSLFWLAIKTVAGAALVVVAYAVVAA